MSEKGITRRDFIVKGTLAAAAVGSGLVPESLFGFETAENIYDYIVVGSGAGGGPVCANLAKAGYRVLLIEAGGNTENANYRVPAFQGLVTEDPNYSWSFFVKHYGDSKRAEADTKHVSGRGILYPRAATLGGCTAHNAMITMYPDSSDWNNIASLTDDRSWDALAMRSYFQRLENARYLKDENAKAQRHGKNGWLNTERTSTKFLLRDKVLLEMVLAAGQEAGIVQSLLQRVLSLDEEGLKELLALDPNHWEFVLARQEGLVNTPKATFRGRRNGTRELLLLTKTLYPKKLVIKTNCLATQVLFDEGSTLAVGVEYIEMGQVYEADPRSTNERRAEATRTISARKIAKATREVILAGGAFNTPQLLMLSGVGPREVLEKQGIKVRLNLPGVGQNLQDRYEVGVVAKLRNPLSLIQACTFGQANDPCMKEYEVDPAHSTYSSNGVVIGVKKRSRASKSDPDLFIFGAPGYFKGYYPGWAKAALQNDHFTWAILKGHTRNTAGSVSLKSSDPTQTPEINFRYFAEGNDSTGDDLDAVVEGVRFARKIFSNPHVRRHVEKEVVPGPGVANGKEIREFVEREAWGHHASCSNKMGPKSDPMAVVDSEFRVHGIQGLRIVDASVFPKIPGLFIVVPVYMIAEKASDVILKQVT